MILKTQSAGAMDIDAYSRAKITIQHIAEKAGVSISTISRVLSKSNYPEQIGPLIVVPHSMEVEYTGNHR
jgi:uncharacterized protein YerC